MQVSLELSGHPKANVQKVILHDTTVVGRSRECGLQIASGTVSRKHCEIRIQGSSASVLDLGSSNGTFIDAERLPAGEERSLPPGSRLNIGGVRFIVSYSDASPVDAPADSRTDAGKAPDGVVDGASVVNSAPATHSENAFLSEESIPADDSLLGDELQAEPILPDEPDFPVDTVSEHDSKLKVRPLEDDEIRLSSNVEDESHEVEEDEPILEVDEDQALAFLNDDDESSSR